MPKYKNIRVKKPNGGYRTQRVQVLASGKYKFVKNKGTKRSTKARRRSVRAAPARRRRTYVARRKKRGGGRRKGIRIGATVGVIAGLWATYNWAKQGGSTGDKMGRVVESMIGINPIAGSGQFDWRKMYFTLPAVGGVALSMVASKAGLNRYTPKGINI